MSIVSVGKMWSKDGGTSTFDGKTYSRTFREGWWVVSSADAKTEEVEAATGLPKVGDLYPGAAFIFCRTATPNRVGPIYWTVDVEYSGESGPGGATDSPLNKPPVIRWEAIMNNEAVDQDDWGLPITNSIGDSVEGVTVDVPDMALYVQRNYISWDSYATRAYLRSVNSDYFQGWPPGTAKMRQFSADYVLDKNFGYWSINAMIQFREPWNTIAARTWWQRYHNKGMNVLARTKVTFSIGPTATSKRAMGYPVIDDSGVITAIAMTSLGSGYTSAPTVTIESTDGSGATAAATISGAGEVNYVVVTSGGSGYKLGKWLGTDNRKQPTTEPVFLDYDGTQLKNTQLATWIERPVGVFPLPYNALGLI